MKQTIFSLMLFILWIALAWSFDLQNVIAGIITAVLGTVLFASLFFPNASQIINPVKVFWFLYFIPVFMFYMVRANLDVAYRVLHLNVPIRPGIVKVTTKLKSDIGLTMLANAITLTPGTLTIDIIGSDMYIHWIYVAADDPAHQTQLIISKFEKILLKVFG